MPYELIATLMFSTMMLMLLTGQRVFGAIGFVAVMAALLLWGDRGGYDIGFAAAMKLMKWYPLLTLPMFIFMGYVLSESKIADDLYRMFHVWMGGLRGGLAVGTILGILVPPSVVLVLYAMIARQPVGQLWLAGIVPGLMMAAMFVAYIVIRCRINPALGPVLDDAERDMPRAEKIRLLRAGLLPLGIFAVMMVPFVNGWTSLVESSAIGALAGRS